MTDNVVMACSSELAAACAVQQRFLEHGAPQINNVSYSAQCRQLGDLGGDCYDFIRLSDDRLAFMVGDASGKGVAAAPLIASVQSSIRIAALFSNGEPAVVLETVNRQLYASSPPNQYATAFYGAFDVETNTLNYVNAGHNPPLLIRRDGSTDLLAAGGAPLGMFPDWACEPGTVQLGPGDLLLAYTDGVTEVMNQAGHEWGVEGIRRAVITSCNREADDLVETIFAGMNKFSDGCRSDDATVLALRVG